MSEASFYLRVPKGIIGLLTNKETGAPVAYEYRSYFAEFQIPRLPNKKPEQNAALKALLPLMEAEGGDEFEFHAAHGTALKESMAQLGDKIAPEMPVGIYVKTQDFYTAILNMPTTKPEGWTGKRSRDLPQEEKAAAE